MTAGGLALSSRERRRQLEDVLLAGRPLWQPQPFRVLRPAWTGEHPALADRLLASSADELEVLNDDSAAAVSLLCASFSELADLPALTEVAACVRRPRPAVDAFWDWEIPGRKREQIEAFATAVTPSGQPLLDWCGGKGHLGRLLALSGDVPVHSLEWDAALCASGARLAQRAAVDHTFVCADALQVADWPRSGQHAVALHACGDLHRQLIRRGVDAGVAAFDVAPCCYYRGVDDVYRPLAAGSRLELTRDDTRLAVTETVTAGRRERRQRDQSLAWKLGFDAWQRHCGDGHYRPFKPVPERWLRASFSEFMAWMVEREGLPDLSPADAGAFEAAGWRRRHEVMAFSVLRHAFRRALELWLVLDLAVCLEERGYAVDIGEFCARRLTPRNLLLSARRQA